MRSFVAACLLLAFTLPCASFAQTADKMPAPIDQAEQAEPPLPTNLPADLREIVKKQFGDKFRVAVERWKPAHRYLKPQPEGPQWNVLLTTDLDADGVEDAVIVAKSTNPLAGQMQYNFIVLDPYFAAFGYGNPKVTAAFGSELPGGNYVVLVIHGAGAEAWRAATPKAKFAIINLPFNTVNVAPVMLKKKKFNAILLEEDGAQQSSVVYWDGKKYRWKDTGQGPPI